MKVLVLLAFFAAACLPIKAPGVPDTVPTVPGVQTVAPAPSIQSADAVTPVPMPNPTPVATPVQNPIPKEPLLTYSLVGDNVADPKLEPTFTKIKTVMDKAMKYYNEYSSLAGKLEVRYDPAIVTAQFAKEGNVSTIRFGGQIEVSTAFLMTSTNFGVGSWGDLIKDGVFLGAKTTKLIRELNNDPTAVIKGDAFHFWPFGLNFPDEYTSETILINNVKLVEAIHKDIFNLP